jgi:lipid A 3-O-deacylase
MPSPLARLFSVAALVAAFVAPLGAQSNSQIAGSQSSTGGPTAAAATTVSSSISELLVHHPWNYGAFFNGGVGTGERSDYTFFSVGARAGKVLTDPAGPGLLRGQFEYSGEILPWWQANTPRFDRAFVSATSNPNVVAISGLFPTGGAYNGVSITPIILRWDLEPHRRVLPFVQGAGGLVWTDHKFPPVGPFNTPGHQGASVFNFTPQFGVGFQYFVRPRRSITFNANAVHISSASLGDSNPGVNASVQFQLGYSWWK